jgi:hypothetical protein
MACRGRLETVEYVPMNPVRRGLVKRAEEWKGSGSVGPWACPGLRPTPPRGVGPARIGRVRFPAGPAEREPHLREEAADSPR